MGRVSEQGDRAQNIRQNREPPAHIMTQKSDRLFS